MIFETIRVRGTHLCWLSEGYVLFTTFNSLGVRTEKIVVSVGWVKG